MRPFAIHYYSSSSCLSFFSGLSIKMGSSERTPGGEDTLPAALQTGKHKHSHVMMEFCSFTRSNSPSLTLLPPSLSPRADNSALGLPHLHTHPHTQGARGEVGAKLREKSQRFDASRGCFPRVADSRSMGIRCAWQTRAHSSLLRR